MVRQAHHEFTLSMSKGDLILILAASAAMDFIGYDEENEQNE